MSGQRQIERRLPAWRESAWRRARSPALLLLDESVPDLSGGGAWEIKQARLFASA